MMLRRNRTEPLSGGVGGMIGALDRGNRRDSRRLRPFGVESSRPFKYNGCLRLGNWEMLVNRARRGV